MVEAMLEPASYAFLLTALITGIRHSMDMDHIAAISDITSTQSKTSSGIFMSFLYGAGHASIVAAIALGLLITGFALPKGTDRIMEIAVGVTLITLGTYVLYSLYTQKDFRMLPRWAIAANAIINTYSLLKAKLTGTPREHRNVLKNGYGNRASYVIGIIHGIGAETPTQMMLFALTVSTGVANGGAVIIVLYSVGLVITSTFLGVLGSYGYIKSSGCQRLYRSLAFVTGSFSILLGALFLINW